MQYLERKTPEKWAEALHQQTEKHNTAALTVSQAEQKYLEVVRQWDLYASSCFFATVLAPDLLHRL
jgi:hypothetical protein